MRLEGKVALVTGAASGNGAVIAMAFLEEGANVVFADKNKKSLNDLASNLELDSERILLHYIDVSDRKTVKECVSNTLDKFGKLDILVANAGITVSKHFLEQTDQDISEVLEVNVKGVFISGQEAAKVMESGGSIINMSSIASEIAPRKHIVSYGASKGAVQSMTRHMALDLSEYNIRVNSLAPGTIVTKINEKRLSDENEYNKEVKKMMLNRLGEPQDIVGAAIFLASNESSFMTGAQIVIDGGEIAH